MNKKNYNHFLFISLILLVFVNSEIKIEEITFEKEEIKIDNLIENKYYYIKPKSSSSLTNYLKIVVIDNKGNKDSYLNFVNYVISYYQGDKTFSNRKQLSYGSLNTTSMWLKKEQVKDGFYLSIETTYSDCDYSLLICQKNTVELLPGEQYSYYITNENKEMIFSIRKEIFSSEEEKYINFWALGSNNIISSIKGNYSDYSNDYKKHPNYNAYIIKVENRNYEYNITISGKPGDLIKIGNLACSSQECKINYFYEGVEYFGLLISNYEDTVCFNEKVMSNKGYIFVNYDDYGDTIDHSIIHTYDIIQKDRAFACIKHPGRYNIVLYSIKGTNNNIKRTQNFTLYPLTYGYNHSFLVSKGNTLKLFPLNYENFEYLTYNILSYPTKGNVSLLNCEDYPLCLRSDDIKNIIPIQGAYGSFSFSFNKKDINNFSPVGKNQKIIIYTCTNQYCALYSRLYTDKSYLRTVPKTISEYRMIRKGNEDYLYLEDFGIVSIETLSGKISLSLERLENWNSYYNEFSYKNINSYALLIFSGKNLLFFKIKGEKNSVYSIKTYNSYYDGIDKESIKSFDVGGNYLLEFKYNEDIKYKLGFSITNELLFKFYPVGCDIEAKKVDELGNYVTYTPSSLEHKFYQEIYSYNETFGQYDSVFSIEPKEKKTCLIYASLFFLNKSNEILEHGIVLGEKMPQSFLFTKQNNELVFIYYFIEIEEKINIKFNLLNKGYYIVTFFINDIDLGEKYEIKKSKNIELKQKLWKNICINTQQICKMSFNVKSSKEENSFMEIIINDKTSKKTVIYIVVFSIIGLILIALVIFFVVKYKRKNRDDLKAQIEKETSGNEARLM